MRACYRRLSLALARSGSFTSAALSRAWQWHGVEHSDMAGRIHAQQLPAPAPADYRTAMPGVARQLQACTRVRMHSTAK